ncbi:MAG: nitrogenase cofactor biosynthesis protein NifB [Deltaproteobacteria bacterium]|jgi:nitrogen fixation protein NifB|nr:nitrogenase cofactor biosynthesis protein NifB [Deltaproteobacteria bacterium]MCL5879923.1 nitrogenase cofactor biosynthesis protein NifB [Deltaproteobacteria bacterium]MDA8304324.1 nitrogenase cofactor biosynthesis protein NifB [Deltaproteobacteria bacterium]
MNTEGFRLNKNKNSIEKHPCFSKEASKHFGRVHLPVAKSCNISCNYCHRDYDCPNESRPGVTSGLLTPEDAVKRIYEVKSLFNDISVAAVAGPGDSLAEPRNTMKTFELITREFPEIILCMSTNGLNLADNLNELKDKGVNFITVTLNAIDESIAAKIYSYVNYNGASYTGKDAAGLLLERQIEGIEKAVKMGFTIKINSVLIPGINDFHMKALSEAVKKLGVYLFNVMPMIPAEKSYFYKIGVKGASRRDVIGITDGLEGINIMSHCRQCRSDAAGLLNEDLSKKLSEQEGESGCKRKKMPC